MVFPKVRLEFDNPMRGPVVFRRRGDGAIRINSAGGDEVDIKQTARIMRSAVW
jgi:hypothetical protein